MRLLPLILTTIFLNVSVSAYACVEVDLSTGTYTVDQHGCVHEKN